MKAIIVSMLFVLLFTTTIVLAQDSTAIDSTKDITVNCSGTTGFMGVFLADGCLNIEAWTSKSVTSFMNVYGYLQVSRDWGEAGIGPEFAFGDLAFGTTVGVESGRNQPRLSSYLMFGGDDFFLVAAGEWNVEDKFSDGAWYNVQATHTFGEYLTAGFMARRWSGFGPRVETEVPGTGIKVWAAPLYEFEVEHKWKLVVEASCEF